MISIDWRAAGIAAAVLSFATPALAGPMVLRASGPSAASFKPGQRLADGAAVQLKAGDTLAVLDTRGTRSLSGPGSFRFDTASASAAPAPNFTDLLTQKTERRARIGAVRGGPPPGPSAPQPPGIWAIDAAAGGTVCVLDPAQVSLWRADGNAPAAVAVSKGALRGEVAFAPGQLTAAWPAAVPLADGEKYAVTGLARPAMLTTRLLTPPASLDALATALIAAGCTSQVERMARLTWVPE